MHSYKYLGTTIDDKLRWDDNTMNIYKKGQQRLYFLRKLNALHIDRNILFVFHDSFVKSVMTFGLVCWWGNLSVKNREKLNRIYTISCKIATKIVFDPTNFLHDCYELLPSGRRYRMPTVKTQRALKSFIPSSIKYMNQPHTKFSLNYHILYRCQCNVVLSSLLIN